jgi:hypothetical protein
LIEGDIEKIKIVSYNNIIEHGTAPPLDLLVGVQILPGEIKLILYVIRN